MDNDHGSLVTLYWTPTMSQDLCRAGRLRDQWDGGPCTCGAHSILETLLGWQRLFGIPSTSISVNISVKANIKTKYERTQVEKTRR